jgi:LacI family transcriptional regulator
MQDVAKLAGVSMATVSRVLSGHPDVSPETRDAVHRVVRRYGYSKNRSAGALSAGKTSLVGVTLPRIDAPYFAAILDSATEALYEQDLRVVLCPTHHVHEREVVLVERLMHGLTAGALLVMPHESNEELKTLQNHGFPFVVVDPVRAVSDGIPCVSPNHHIGAIAATEHLIQLGHRRIAAIKGSEGWLATEERLKAFRSTLLAAGIRPDPSLEVSSDYGVELGHDAALALFDRADPPTAIFGFNDNIAIGAMIAAGERGLRVPDDVSIVGFDDVAGARTAFPPLTTVRQPLAEMGRIAVDLLMRLVEEKPLDAVRVDLQNKLVVRKSTAAPAR